MTPAFAVLSSAILLVTIGHPLLAEGPKAPAVVFVCEHGSSKSVIAAAHFNQLAEGRGLPYRAVSRGIQSDAVIPEAVRSGLLAEGLDVASWAPKRLTDDDLKRAKWVVTLNCKLRKSKALGAGKKIEWADLPAVSDGYTSARTAIVQHVDELLRSLISATLHH
jgi:protein-tyrosine-phosphatase